MEQEPNPGASANTERRVREIISRTFRLSAQEAQEELAMGNLPQWDSLGHMELIVGIEKEFGVVFPTYAVAELVSVPSIVRAIEKQGAK